MALLSHRQEWSWAVCLSLFPFLFNSSRGEAQSFTYRATTSEVRITFFASDEHNRPIENLGKDDFAVVDNGVVIREFRSLSRAPDAAFHVVALVDTSQSIQPYIRAAMESLVQLASQTPLTSDNEFSVVSFSGLQPTVLCTADCHGPDAKAKLLAVQAKGTTPLFDSLDYAAKFTSSRHTAGIRDVIILFSDGEDNVSSTSARDAVEAVVASGAPLFTVDVNESRSPSRGAVTLASMAEATGGRYLSMQDGAANALLAIFANLRASYVVTYQLHERTIGFHSLRIVPKHNLNLRFHSRRGYYYEEVP